MTALISKGGENNGSIYTSYCATVVVFIAVAMTSSSSCASLGSCTCIYSDLDFGSHHKVKVCPLPPSQIVLDLPLYRHVTLTWKYPGV